LKLSGEKDLVKEETGMCCFDGRRKKEIICNFYFDFCPSVFLSFHQFFVILVTYQPFQRVKCHATKLMAHNGFLCWQIK
jgi:hypothetical protein